LFKNLKTQSNKNSIIDMGNQILKYDVIHDALEVIYNKTSNAHAICSDIAYVANIGTG
jgi:hypothetical protein